MKEYIVEDKHKLSITDACSILNIINKADISFRKFLVRHIVEKFEEGQSYEKNDFYVIVRNALDFEEYRETILNNIVS